MDDPASPTIYRVSGPGPYPEPGRPGFPPSIRPRQVTLRDRQTIATVVPFASSSEVPPSLLKYLSDQFAKEIEGGDSYPMIEPMPLEKYSAYWFQNFAGIMLLGTIDGPEQVVEGKDWSKECLGSFYIKPNYPGRSSHVCNAGFLVTDAARNRGVGRLMGESYLDWAPRLGYTYSVFNLVYETNVASCKIWDALGFKRIGRVKGCGNLKSYPDRLVDAIIYGRDLGEAPGDATDGPVSEERFDKIKFYLKYGKYPNGSDRAEKSRLRSAATHYKLLENDVLMLKDKEVISDPVRQLDIAKNVHEAGNHAGINKTTATIAERYHWSRIKETVSDIIRLCSECKELGKVPLPNAATRRAVVNHVVVPGNAPDDVNPPPSAASIAGQAAGIGRVLDLRLPPKPKPAQYENHSDIASLLNPMHPMDHSGASGLHASDPMLLTQAHTHHQAHHTAVPFSMLHGDPTSMYSPIDPQIISDSVHQGGHDTFDAFHDLSQHAQSDHTPLPGHESYHHHMGHHHPHPDDPSLQQLQDFLHDDPDDMPQGLGHAGAAHHSVALQHELQDVHDQAAVDRDIDMLIEHHDDSDVDNLDDAVLDGRDDQRQRDRRRDSEISAEKRDRHNTVSEDDRSPKRRNWDHVVFDVP
ncbi:uncharacterized protein JN550_005250 [Neoarthrinium moseri]|uniref:uncharacterized protein n=1 Tax=Neoarthrinium moseri TaxID=1658444 RepID=UPI001FDD1374|nr:uncharacterized protein JN550_005250 [Neoarthrinium moseri]KAI1870322.1 hypothetical protein JN550_005250 [Neoarthrinium moseri]